MGALTSFLDACRAMARRVMGVIARSINNVTHGQISPTSITLIALTAHVPIAWLIGLEQNILAAFMLFFFGLFDALDGELARLQGKAGNAGMVLDAVTDRMKEVLLYTGAAYALIASGQPYYAVWAVAACGASLAVSYVKAKGETAVAGGTLSANQVNRLFQDGLLRYEIRMLLLIIGLLADKLAVAVVIITIFSGLTACGRLVRIIKHLDHVQS